MDQDCVDSNAVIHFINTEVAVSSRIQLEGVLN
jgi:hypothetical protein